MFCEDSTNTNLDMGPVLIIHFKTISDAEGVEICFPQLCPGRLKWDQSMKNGKVLLFLHAQCPVVGNKTLNFKPYCLYM